MSTDQKTINWYNEHAQDYANHVRTPDTSPYHSLYEKPAMYSLLPDLKDKKVISLGCGVGEDCHYLKSMGASSSVGIDISKNEIKIAMESYKDCKFIEMDMEKLQFPDESFDFAYSSLVFSYLKDWTKALGEIFRILKPGSSLLLSCDHPVATAMAKTEDEDEKRRELIVKRDKKTDKTIVIGDYFSRRTVHQNDWNVTNWHKPISEMFDEILKSGFEIVSVVEPKPLKEMEKVSKSDYLKLLKIPEFLILKLKKR